MFDVDHFKNVLKTQWLGHDFQYIEELESTNSYLKKVPESEMSHGKVCLADHQTKGRGQYERGWESMPGKNLTFTIGFLPSVAERLHVLTLACAFSVVELIESETRLKAFIKWPNDIIVNERKLAGLLTETVFSGNRLDRVVVGIGFNINQEKFGPEINQTATSLLLEGGRSFEREQLLADYLGLVEYSYHLWNRNEKNLLKSINQKIIGYGDWISLSVNGHQRAEKYKLIGINERGELTVINEESELETFSYEQIRLITG